MVERYAKGCAWLDYDNDDFPDLFVNNGQEYARLYHNERDGRFVEVTTPMGIDGPLGGFSCWSFDFDNDGWLDLFAVSYMRHRSRRPSAACWAGRRTGSRTGCTATSRARASRT